MILALTLMMMIMRITLILIMKVSLLNYVSVVVNFFLKQPVLVIITISTVSFC
jgi:hypothetical protein